MRTDLKFLVSLLLVALLAVNCGKNDPVPIAGKPAPKEPAPNPVPVPKYLLWDYDEGVYVAGGGYGPERDVVKIWGSGNEQVLPDGDIDAYATSIFVCGDEIYVAGYEYNWNVYDGWYRYPTKAMVWKNGVAQPLTDGTNEACALSMFVSDNDVYVAGYESNGIKSVAMVWKNGVAEPLSDGTVDAYATSVFVAGGDIYVAGYEVFGPPSYTSTARLWKNGQPQALVAGYIANSVFVSGSDVYVAGSGYTHAMIWKNGVAQYLTGTSQASALSVYVAGDDVYVAGYEFSDLGKDTYGPTKAIIWKNGVSQPLTTGTENASANSITVFGDDIYAVGYKGDMAVIWKNNVGKVLGDGNASSVFIKR